MNPLQNVETRVLTYAMSWLLGLLPAGALGFVHYDAAAMILTIDMGGIVTATVTSLVGSFGVFKLWGTR